MSDQHVEHSESGAPIYRHEAKNSGVDLAHGDEESIEAITDHIEKYVGPVAGVYHEIVSDLVHVDIHIVAPTPERNFYTLVTSGMSDRPMHPPEDYADHRFAEMMICLPPTWPLKDKDLKREVNYWPLRWLKILARLPHEYDTWLCAAHTVPNGDPPKPFADNTKMCCALLLQPFLFGEEFHTLRVNAMKTIHLLSLVPIYKEEMELKLREGLDPILDLLVDAGFTELLDVKRKNVCRRKF